ncbi:MAG: nitrous oxide reductase family maturation protein NosD [Sulfurimicrobium sp.]|nr:nitrous oxide reductase family maturation protein NosD [Sulfurimicrobium sp.]MDP1705499.1 nitrous oxide reductase family maturation protein NosD [Sulfurimicrobium sp.]MDP2199191.1 nitrous oxide reductase family maturation protein NosD [Sulfurimicrobium sp.]MDP3686413.1 nitrous oxide reductase family maturation protein NosD [Sulfurimicrobium sp.]
MLIFLVRPFSVLGQPSLQSLVDATPLGGTLRLSPGIYAGPVTISRPIVLEGGGKAIIDGGGKRSILWINTGNAVVRGLVLRNTGNSHDQMDSGIAIAGDSNRIEDNVIENALFGIVLKQSRRNLVRRNHIRSKAAELSMRGESVRLWNSTDNRIENNDIADTRDFTLMNSPNNHVSGNSISGSRYGMHLIFSPNCHIEGNRLSSNATGIVVLNSDYITIRGNTLQHSSGIGGACITIKKSTEILAEDNRIVHCATGILSDSPVGDLSKVVFRNNLVAHSTTGVQLYGERGGHTFEGNRFEKNLFQVVMSGSGDAQSNRWYGNYWDDYQGFDLNHDGVGDTPHEVYAYADRIWMETPAATFFRNSPALELLDFLERLAPFSAPDLLLRDPKPRFSPTR